MDSQNSQKIDRVLQFSLLTAGQEDFGSRELGPIHLIKYLYLADLEHAKYKGTPYTNVPWTFYHFGPWDHGAFSRIEPALEAIGARKRTIDSAQSKYEKEFVRWLATDEKLHEELERELPLIVRGVVHKYVHQFNAVTEDLLHYVYTTWPMLNAKPGEALNFNLPDYLRKKKRYGEQDNENEQLTVRQQKKRTESIRVVKSEFRKRLKAKRRKPKIRLAPPPYDDIYFEGLKTLDSLAGKEISDISGVVSFSDDIWKSKARFDPDVP